MRFFKSCRRVKRTRAREMLFLIVVVLFFIPPETRSSGSGLRAAPERLASRHHLVQRKPQSPKVTSGV